MKPKIHVVRLAVFRTVSTGADGRVLNAGPGTVISAVAAGVTSIGVCTGASVVVVWLTGGGTKTGSCVGDAVLAGATVGCGVGLGVGSGVGRGVLPGGGWAWHQFSSNVGCSWQ